MGAGPAAYPDLAYRSPAEGYRWERELLSVASTAKALSETPAVAFAELPVPKQVRCNTTERSATLRVGKE